MLKPPAKAAFDGSQRHMQAQGDLPVAALVKIAEFNDLPLRFRKPVDGFIGAEMFKGGLLRRAAAFHICAKMLAQQFQFSNMLAAEPGSQHMLRDPNQPGVKRGLTLKTRQC